MAVALVCVAAGSKELCCSERFQHYNHGGYAVSRIGGEKVMTKLVSQTKFKKYRETWSVKADMDISSSNITSENVSRITGFPDLAGLVTDGSARHMLSSEQKVYDVVLKQAAMVKKEGKSQLLDVKSDLVPTRTLQILDEAYERCREVCAETANNYYLGTISSSNV